MKVMALGCTSLLAIGAGCYFLMPYSARSPRVISFDAQKQIADLCALGFDERSSALKALYVLEHCSEKTVCDIASITELTKALLISFVHDAQRCQMMHLKSDHILLAFIHDKILRLTIGLDELQRQRNEHDESSAKELADRLERMREITFQSIAHAKRDLWRMMRHEISNDKMLYSFLKEQLAEKTILACQMQRMC